MRAGVCFTWRVLSTKERVRSCKVAEVQTCLETHGIGGISVTARC